MSFCNIPGIRAGYSVDNGIVTVSFAGTQPLVTDWVCNLDPKAPGHEQLLKNQVQMLSQLSHIIQTNGATTLKLEGVSLGGALASQFSQIVLSGITAVQSNDGFKAYLKDLHEYYGKQYPQLVRELREELCQLRNNSEFLQGLRNIRNIHVNTYAGAKVAYDTNARACLLSYGKNIPPVTTNHYAVLQKNGQVSYLDPVVWSSGEIGLFQQFEPSNPYAALKVSQEFQSKFLVHEKQATKDRKFSDFYNPNASGWDLNFFTQGFSSLITPDHNLLNKSNASVLCNRIDCKMPVGADKKWYFSNLMVQCGFAQSVLSTKMETSALEHEGTLHKDRLMRVLRKIEVLRADFQKLKSIGVLHSNSGWESQELRNVSRGLDRDSGKIRSILVGLGRYDDEGLKVMEEKLENLNQYFMKTMGIEQVQHFISREELLEYSDQCSKAFNMVPSQNQDVIEMEFNQDLQRYIHDSRTQQSLNEAIKELKLNSALSKALLERCKRLTIQDFPEAKALFDNINGLLQQKNRLIFKNYEAAQQLQEMVHNRGHAAEVIRNVGATVKETNLGISRLDNELNCLSLELKKLTFGKIATEPFISKSGYCTGFYEELWMQARQDFFKNKFHPYVESRAQALGVIEPAYQQAIKSKAYDIVNASYGDNLSIQYLSRGGDALSLPSLLDKKFEQIDHFINQNFLLAKYTWEKIAQNVPQDVSQDFVNEQHLILQDMQKKMYETVISNMQLGLEEDQSNILEAVQQEYYRALATCEIKHRLAQQRDKLSGFERLQAEFAQRGYSDYDQGRYSEEIKAQFLSTVAKYQNLAQGKLSVQPRQRAEKTNYEFEYGQNIQNAYDNLEGQKQQERLQATQAVVDFYQKRFDNWMGRRVTRDGWSSGEALPSIVAKAFCEKINNHAKKAPYDFADQDRCYDLLSLYYYESLMTIKRQAEWEKRYDYDTQMDLMRLEVDICGNFNSKGLTGSPGKQPHDLNEWQSVHVFDFCMPFELSEDMASEEIKLRHRLCGLYRCAYPNDALDVRWYQENIFNDKDLKKVAHIFSDVRIPKIRQNVSEVLQRLQQIDESGRRYRWS